jgi:hypothetical protein
MDRRTRAEQLQLKYRRTAGKARGREQRIDPAAIDDLLRRTESSDAEERNQAALLLCPCHVQANVTSVWDRLLAMVDDPNLHVRTTIFHTLCDGSPREREGDVVQALEKLYHDPDPKLRRRARQLLASYRRTGKLNIL